MPENTRTFQCPSCGASLEPQVGLTAMKCGYCGTSVVVPEDLRASPRTDAGPVYAGGMDLNRLIAHAGQMGEVARLARTGDREAAIKLYQENSGVDYENARMAIEAIASGRAPDLNLAAAAPIMAEVITAAAAARALEGNVRPRPRRASRSCGGTLILAFFIAAIAIWALSSTGYLGTVTNILNSVMRVFVK
jgi:predicted RNA-binding Zn-ribbon protein involved in translation (DUF1610 family)